ncbi:phage tail protein [Acidaminococcus intestini]|uniref:phage tail protein n=1 Tax=Acidaminococcus intestini TaxID=187327 RepID=UPI002673ED87|nr:hypothetical protein [Acidaminococcus intestini]
MARGINVLLTLVDKFSQPLKRVTGETKKTTRQIRNATNMVNSFAGGANQKFLSLAGSVAKFGAGLAAIGTGLAIAGIKSFADESIEKANAQIAAETKLVTILNNVKDIQSQGAGAAERAAKSLQNYASQLQTVGVVGDEVTIAGMAQLGTFQMTEEQIKKVSGGMLDLLVNQKGLNATQEDAVNVANMIGKVMMGNVGALQRVGISLDDYQKQIIKTGTADERAAMIAEVLAQNVGGVNEAMRKTDAGQAAAIMNDYGDMQEEVGKKLVKMRTKLMNAFAVLTTPIGKALEPVLDSLTAKFEEMLPTIRQFATNLAAQLPGIVENIASSIEFLATHFQDFMELVKNVGPIIAGIATGFAAFNIITGIIGKVAMLQKLFSGIKLAGGIVQFAAMLNPIGLVAAAIGVLAVAFYTLYTQSEPFRNAVNRLGTRLFTLAEIMASVLAPVMEAQWGLITSVVGAAVDVIGTILGDIIDVIASIIEFIVNVFTGNWEGAWNNVVEIFSGIFTGLKDIAMAPLDFILGMIDRIASKISSIKLPSIGGGGAGESPDHNALGTSFFRGGPTYVNENGGELITLPSGSQIMPHQELLQLVNNGGGGGRVTVNLTVQGNVIGNREYMRQTGEYIAKKVRDALRNS